MPALPQQLLFEIPLMPSTPAAPATRPGELLPSHDRILQAVLRYRLLTNDRLARLLHKGVTSLTTVATRTKWLREQGYLKDLGLRPLTRIGGSGASVYTLSSAGYRYLRQQGYDVPTRYNERELDHLSDEYKRNKLQENDVLIAAEVLCRDYPVVTLQDLRHEYQLKQQKVTVSITVGSGPDSRHVQRTVTPDGWLHFSVTTPTGAVYDQPIAFEVDRGTEDQKAWKRKIRSLIVWAEGPYEQAFGTDALVIAVLAVPNPRSRLSPEVRRDQLMAWTRSELSHLVETHQTRHPFADLSQWFVFGAADPQTVPPAQLFFAPLWSELTSEHPVPLLPDVLSHPA
jgi:Replication-relaxation